MAARNTARRRQQEQSPAEELSAEELDAQEAAELPAREAMSIVDLGLRRPRLGLRPPPLEGGATALNTVTTTGPRPPQPA
jgi:hypothetical protein